MERLSTLDAEFLHLEDDGAPMHIAGACLFDGEAPTLDEIRLLIASKLHRIPRYRQRIERVPLELGRPLWVDDGSFDLADHVREVEVPAPGDDRTLRRLMGTVMAQRLPRDRPLWDALLVTGLRGDGPTWALVFKVHHCMVDGIAGVQLLEALLDVSPDATVASPEPWEPKPEPGALDRVLDAWGGLVDDAGALAASAIGSVPALLRDPLGLPRSLGSMAGGLLQFARILPAPRPASIEGSVGRGRVWAHSSASLEDVRAVRRSFGGTVNDVVMAALSAGYRELLAAHGDDVEHLSVRSMVPVSVRRDDGQGVPDNRVSTLVCELAVHEVDPVARLECMKQRLAAAKASNMAEVGEAVTALGDVVLPAVVGSLSRLALRSEHLVPQRSINTVTTNVPGPQFPLYCLGRELVSYLPFVGISYGVRVSTAVLSYNGRLFFGVTGDRDTVPDVARIADRAAAEIAELAALARSE